MVKKSFSTSIRCSKYSEFVKNLSPTQKDVVRSCGFGSLLHFNCTETPRSVAYMLARRFDVPTRTVIMENGSSFPPNPFLTHQILGVPLGGWKEHAKALRESLVYYLLTHPDNTKFDSLVHVKNILSIHGITRNSYN